MKKDCKKNAVLKAFGTFGFNVYSERNHIKMRSNKGQTLTLPNHKRIKGSLLSRVCREVGLDKMKFFEMI